MDVGPQAVDQSGAKRAHKSGVVIEDLSHLSQNGASFIWRVEHQLLIEQ